MFQIENQGRIYYLHAKLMAEATRGATADEVAALGNKRLPDPRTTYYFARQVEGTTCDMPPGARVAGFRKNGFPILALNQRSNRWTLVLLSLLY